MAPNRGASHSFPRPTWRRLLRRHAADFVDWLRPRRWTDFSQLAVDLNCYVEQELTSPHAALEFARSLRAVLEDCNKPIYNDPFCVLAYAHVHFLERYWRFGEVMIALTEAHALPLREQPLDMLDVGAGPAPTAYAAMNHYTSLREFGREQGVTAFESLRVQIECLDSGSGWLRFLHSFAERSGREVFRVHWTTFEDFDRQAEQRDAREQRVRQIAREDDVGMKFAAYWIQENEPGWNESWHHDLVVLSNVITRTSDVPAIDTSLRRVALTLRPGGVVVVTGGVGGQYPEIYKSLDSSAEHAGLRRVAMGETIRRSYNDEVSMRIKHQYDSVWNHLTILLSNTELVSVRDALPVNARDLWDPHSAYRNSSEFAVRAYRRGR